MSRTRREREVARGKFARRAWLVLTVAVPACLRWLRSGGRLRIFFDEGAARPRAVSVHVQPGAETPSGGARRAG